MEIEPKKFNEFAHLVKIEAKAVDTTSWEHRKEIWSRNHETVVILCGDKHWKMSRTEWGKAYKEGVIKQGQEEYVDCRCLRCKKEYQILAFCIRDNKAGCPHCIGSGVPI